jgi:hypothetical protein
MRTIGVFMCMLFLYGIVLSADTTSAANPAAAPAAAPAPASAPEPAVTPAPAPAPAPVAEQPAPAPAPAPKAAAAPAGPSVIWSGMAMLRLREEVIQNKLKSGVKQTLITYSNRIAYKLGAKIKANDEVSFQFDIGNDWYATEEYQGMPGNYYGKRNPLDYPFFDLAYVQWDPGCMHVLAGVIPVKGSYAMDLIGVSILFNKIYKMAAHIPWGVVTNFSQTGLRIGAPILKDDFKLGVDLTTGIIQQRKSGVLPDLTVYSKSAVELLLDVPISYDAFTACPQLVLIPNRSWNRINDKTDMELALGTDLGYKINSGVTIRAGFGFAKNSNDNSYDPKNPIGNWERVAPLDPTNKDTVLVKPRERTGINLGAGTTIKLGPGKLDFDFNYSKDKDDKDTTVDDAYPFVDLKYGYPLNKNFIVMPRVRLFFSQPHTTYSSMLTAWPELMIFGTF